MTTKWLPLSCLLTVKHGYVSNSKPIWSRDHTKSDNIAFYFLNKLWFNIANNIKETASMSHLRPHKGRDGESYSQPFCAHLADCDPYTICSSPQWKYTVSLKSYESLSGDTCINPYVPCTKLSLLQLIPGKENNLRIKIIPFNCILFFGYNELPS